MRELIIVGGGLAGLAAAREATSRGVDWQLVEAGDVVGGRVASEIVGGYTIDRGFQVLLTSYPELVRLNALESLSLGRFEPGALVRMTGPKGAAFHLASDPWRRPMSAFGLGWLRVFGVKDAFRLARLRSSLKADDPDATSMTTLAYLTARGFSPEVIERFFRPFFGGVFLDRALETPASFMRRLFGHFSRGDAAIPCGGMAGLAAAIAAPLDPSRIVLGAPVAEVLPGEVVLASGARIAAKRVLVATAGHHAARLLPASVEAPRWRATTSLYFSSSGPLPKALARPLLVLDGDGTSPIHHLAPLSSLGDGFAPPGQGLIVVSHDGVADSTIEGDVTAELQRWFPATDWRLVAARPIAEGLPALTTEPTTSFIAVGEGLAVAGDHVADRSIDGALRSGRLAAERLLTSL